MNFGINGGPKSAGKHEFFILNERYGVCFDIISDAVKNSFEVLLDNVVHIL